MLQVCLLTTVVFVCAAGTVGDSVAVGGGGQAGSVGTQEADATLAPWGHTAAEGHLTVAKSVHIVHPHCSRVSL